MSAAVPDGVLSAVSRLVSAVRTVYRGPAIAVEHAVVCLLSRGHLLIEDVPGVGKTMLAKALARSIDGTAQRIQFTPDLLPGDITGVSIFN
ncbi:MAG TPA: AAA family ATPase, partial [Thermoanaerobaculia bacterium]|nr:AAA family ATPase [Thermoanaerobaculia bacterium]